VVGVRWLCTVEPFLGMPGGCAPRRSAGASAPCPLCCGFVSEDEARARRLLLDLERDLRAAA
jgi:hypothetical protein